MKVKKRLRKIETSYVGSNKNSPILWRRKMNKFIPLSSLKDTTGIIELCNKAGEPVVVNRNGELKYVKALICRFLLLEMVMMNCM